MIEYNKETMRYTICFNGRKRGAIGILCTFTAVRDAGAQQEAEMALYDKYEHIHVRAVSISDSVGELPPDVDHTWAPNVITRSNDVR